MGKGRRFRWAVLGLAAIAVAVTVVVGLRGTGQESPEAAIYSLAERLEHRDADRVCDRLFPSTSLPASIARALDVASSGDAIERSWEAERRECGREFGRRREFESFEFEDPRVLEVTSIPIRASGGLTRAAAATVTTDGGRAQTLKLVEYREQWRVVFDVK